MKGLEPHALDTGHGTAASTQQDGVASQTVLDSMLNDSRPDEDVNEETIDDSNVSAEVTLPSRVCELAIIVYVPLT